MTVAKTTTDKQENKVLEIVKIGIEAIIIALVIRTFLFQPFNIPSGSLIPTLHVGDYIFVSKYSYGYSRYSFPIDMSFLKGRYWAAEPKRGDIIVFRLPKDPSVDYIKRLIGLPNDRIQMKSGVLYINGNPVHRERTGTYKYLQIDKRDNGSIIGERVISAEEYRETNPEGLSYTVIEANGDRGANDNTEEFRVPAGHYFMMGDNRDNSQDSRVMSEVGFVPAENLVGRAEIVFFSVDQRASALAFWKWPWSVQWDRLFKVIR